MDPEHDVPTCLQGQVRAMQHDPWPEEPAVAGVEVSSANVRKIAEACLT